MDRKRNKMDETIKSFFQLDEIINEGGRGDFYGDSFKKGEKMGLFLLEKENNDNTEKSVFEVKVILEKNIERLFDDFQIVRMGEGFRPVFRPFKKPEEKKFYDMNKISRLNSEGYFRELKNIANIDCCCVSDPKTVNEAEKCDACKAAGCLNEVYEQIRKTYHEIMDE